MEPSSEGIIILGSTGSIGESALEVVRKNQSRFHIVGLTCHSNVDLLAKQIKEFQPKIVSVGAGETVALSVALNFEIGTLKIVEGEQGNKKVATHPDGNKVIAAIMGAAGLKPIMSSIQSKKNVALANKEPMVLAGKLLMKAANKNKVLIFPMDSEHNAIFQALQGSNKSDIESITLTASGGPFRNWEKDKFDTITLKEALQHPNWKMGSKITIDSATMMNKCLEVIEARWLFDQAPEKIHVIVHPESIIHSMVTFQDGSSIAQLGQPDMKIPISYCLGYPNRLISGAKSLDLIQVQQLSFEKPDLEKFPTIQFAYDMLKIGEGCPAALNGANEVLVEYFLEERIQFIQIFELLYRLVYELKNKFNDLIKTHPYLNWVQSLHDAIQSDQFGRNYVYDKINRT